jgi:hypothetical protein
VRQGLEIWRYLGAAVAAVMLGAAQLDPNPLPAWVFPVVAVLALLTLGWSVFVDWRRRR